MTRNGDATAGREIGTFALLALGVNGIVGVGIFFVPADIARLAPGMSVWVIAGTAVAMFPVALTFATLGKRFDSDGGPIVFARAAFGELASFLVGWVAYVSAIVSAAAVIVGLSSALAPGWGLHTGAGVRAMASGIATLLALLCASGIRISARIWSTLTVAKILPLIALAVLAVGASSSGVPVAARGAADPSLLRAGLTAMFAFQGFEIVPVIAGQVRSPAAAIPIATTGSLALAATLYIVLQTACVTLLPDLAGSSAPLADAAAVLAGAGFERLIQIGTSVSAFGIAFGMLVTTPRYLSALAEGRPRELGLGSLSSRGVPMRSLVLTWVAVVLLIQAGERADLFALSSLAVLVQFGVTALSLVALSWRRERELTPAHAWLAYPTLAIAVVLGSGANLRELSVAAAAAVVGLALRRVMHRRPAAG